MKRLIFIILLVMLSVSISSAQNDDTTFAPSENIYGIVEGMWFPELTCDLGVGWERLIFDWAGHQPNSADDWTGFLNIPDEWIWAANDCNREIIAVVKNVPAWATDGTAGIGVPRGLDLPIDDPDNVWANFMRRMADYYQSRGIYRFIIMNEPDIQAGTYGYEFEGTIDEYYQMIRVASLAVKQGNPSAVIHLAGTTYWHDINSGERLYTDRLLERITQDPEAEQHDYYFEALSLHIYFRTDTVYDIVGEYRELMDDYGLAHKAIWITETNASPNLDPEWLVERPQFQITLEQQASFVVQSAVLALSSGAERIAVYKLFDQQLPAGGESFGLLNPASTEPRPAFYSWQMVTTYLQGVISADLAQTDSLDAVRLVHMNDQQTLVLWSRTEQATQVEISATADKAYLLDQYGNAQIIRPENGVYQVNLAGAVCEPDEGCPVGGIVSLLIQPHGDSSLTQLDDDERVTLTWD